MSRVVRWFIAAGLIALLSGCDAKSNDEDRDDAEFDPTPDAGDLGFIHAIPDAPQVTVAYAGSNGGAEQFSLGFGEARRESVLVGGYNVQVTYEDPAGDAVTLVERFGDDNIKLFTDDETTLVLAGTLASPAIFEVSNTEYGYGERNRSGTPLDPQAQFLHTVSGRSTLDFYLTADAAGLAGETPVSLAFGEASALQDIPAGSDYRIRVTPPGDAGNLLYDSGTTSFSADNRVLLAAFNYFGPGDAQLRVKRIQSFASTFPDEPYVSNYRVGQLVADVPAIDVYLGPATGIPEFSGQPFQTVSAYQSFVGGSFENNATVAGVPADVLFSGGITLSPGDAIVQYFAGLRSDPASGNGLNVVGPGAIEDYRPIPDYAQVRAVNGAAGSGPLNVFLLRPGETTASRPATFPLLDFGATQGTVVGSGDYDLVVRDSDGNALIGPERITLVDTSRYSLLLTDTAGGGPPLEWVLDPSPI